MIQTFSVLFSLSGLVLVICFLATLKIKLDFYPYLRIILTTAFISVVCHLIIINFPNLLLVKLAYNIFYLFINIMIFALFEFCRKYTRYKVKLPWFTKLLYVFLIIDATSLILNFFFNHEYILLPYEYRFGSEIFTIYKIKMFFMYYLHLLLSYLLIILSLVALFIRIAKTPSLYRHSYTYILISISITILGDAIWLFSAIPIDFSIIFYSITAILISVYSGRIIPRQILYRQLDAVVSSMNDAVRVFDIDGECIFTNEAMLNLIEKYKSLGLNPDGPFNVLRSGAYYRKLRNLPDREFDESVEKNGEIYNFHVSTHCLRDEKKNFLGAFFVIHDKTAEVKKLNNDLFLTTHDTLTGLLNREGFYEQVRTRLTNFPDEEYMMVVSDIDNFKMVNDNYGRETGDDFLKRAAESLRSHAKAPDIYCRLGSDQFAMFMPKNNFTEEAFIKYSSEVAYINEDLLYPVTFHFGAYEVENIEIPVSTMIDRAFMALENIKGNLQEKFAYYNTELREDLMQEQKLCGEFPGALAEKQFKIYLQPQIKTDNTCNGAEALVRWEHPTKGTLPPHLFIPLFERNGLITELDLYIWELAAKKLHEWKERGLESHYISVNISPKDFLYVDIYKTFVELVEKYQINPKNLKLEITESAVMLNLDIQLGLINKLRNYGFLIEMDDFGSGYSSLNLLKDIPFDILKIDMEFLRATKNTERSIAILHSIIKLSKRLNMPVITEGVETQEQVEFLKEMGTDYYQGFYFDKPMKIKDFEKKYVFI